MRAAALRHGWTPSTYASHENGQTPLPVEAAYEYGRAFKASPGWLLTGEGPKVAPGLTVAGEVGAGAEIVPFPDSNSQEPEPVVEPPPGMPLDTQVVVVRGNSMYPRYFEGEKLFYRRETRDPGELIGRECVVHLADGRMLVKIIRKGSRKNRFNLESWNAATLEDQRIEWAAPVRWRG